MSKIASTASQQPDKSTRAPIWNHWERATDSRKLAQCKYCAKSMYPNTNNMRNHTAKHHPDKIADEMPPMGFDPSTSQIMNPLAGFNLVDTSVSMLTGFPAAINMASQMSPSNFAQLPNHAAMNMNSYSHGFNTPSVSAQYSPVMQGSPSYSAEQVEQLIGDLRGSLATLISSKDLSADFFENKAMKAFLSAYKELIKIGISNNNVDAIAKLPSSKELEKIIIPNLSKKRKHDVIESQNNQDPVILQVAHDPEAKLFQVYAVYSLRIKIFYKTLFCSPNALPSAISSIINEIESTGRFNVRLVSSSFLPLIQHLGTITDKANLLLFWSCTKDLQDCFANFLSSEQNNETIFLVRDILFEIIERTDMRSVLSSLAEQDSSARVNCEISLPTSNPDAASWCKMLGSFLNISDLLLRLNDPIAIRVEHVLPRVRNLLRVSDALIDLTEIIPGNNTYLVSNFKYDIKNTIIEISNCPETQELKILVAQLTNIFRDYEAYNKDVLSLCEFFSNAATHEDLPGAISAYITNIGASYNLPRIKVAKQVRDYMREDHDDPSDPMSFWDKKDSEFTELKRISATIMQMLGMNAADISYNTVDYNTNEFMHLSSSNISKPKTFNIPLKPT